MDRLRGTKKHPEPERGECNAESAGKVSREVGLNTPVLEKCNDTYVGTQARQRRSGRRTSRVGGLVPSDRLLGGDGFGQVSWEVNVDSVHDCQV